MNSISHFPLAGQRRNLRLRSWLLLLGLLAGFGPMAAEPLDSPLTAWQDTPTDPHATAVVIFDRERLTIDPDGRTHTHRELLCRILTAAGRERYRQQVIRYDAHAETVVIDSARIRRADGRWIALDSTAISSAPAPDVKWTAGYSQFREASVRFAAADSGDAVYLAYRIEPRGAARPRGFVPPGGIVLFGGPDPVLEQTYTIDAAEPYRVRSEVTDGELKPLVLSKGSRTVSVWTRLDAPSFVATPPIADQAFILPRLVWTTCPDWEALGTGFGNLFWDKVDSSMAAVDSFTVLTPPTLQGMPALMNATRWVQQNVRTVNRSGGRLDAALHAADWTFRERYGDPLDKAVLLTALLRGYGFGPVPVLVPGRHTPFSELPVLEQFSRVILAIPTHEDTLWIDPAAEHYPPTVLPYAMTYGKGCILVGGAPLVEAIHPGNPASRGARTEIRVSLAADGELSGFVSCEPQGDKAAEARAALANLTDELRAEFIDAAAVRIAPGTQVLSYSISDPADLATPMAVTARFVTPAYARRDSARLVVSVPEAPFAFGRLDFDTTQAASPYPVALPPRIRCETLVTIVLPEGYAVASLPSPLIIDNPYVHIEISSRLGAQSWSWEQVVEIKKDLLPFADYALVRDAFRSAQQLQKRQATFTLKPKLKPAPARGKTRLGRHRTR